MHWIVSSLNGREETTLADVRWWGRPASVKCKNLFISAERERESKVILAEYYIKVYCNYSLDKEKTRVERKEKHQTQRLAI